jgi:hypothetical protein
MAPEVMLGKQVRRKKKKKKKKKDEQALAVGYAKQIIISPKQK